jgi:hypothetical protein
MHLHLKVFNADPLLARWPPIGRFKAAKVRIFQFVRVEINKENCRLVAAYRVLAEPLTSSISASKLGLYCCGKLRRATSFNFPRLKVRQPFFKSSYDPGR